MTKTAGLQELVEKIFDIGDQFHPDSPEADLCRIAYTAIGILDEYLASRIQAPIGKNNAMHFIKEVKPDELLKVRFHSAGEVYFYEHDNQGSNTENALGDQERENTTEELPEQSNR